MPLCTEIGAPFGSRIFHVNHPYINGHWVFPYVEITLFTYTAVRTELSLVNPFRTPVPF